MLLRGAVCDLAERTKQILLRAIASSDEWKTPIVINAQRRQANAPEAPGAQLVFGQTGDGPKLQLDLAVSSDVHPESLQRELLKALLVELTYRQEPNIPPGKAYVIPPAWLIDGLLAQQTRRQDISDVLAALAAGNRAVSLAQFLEQHPGTPGTQSHALYSAYAVAALELITNAPDGRQRLRALISDLRNAPNDALADLVVHFPVLATNGGPEAAWRRELARFATRDAYRLLSVAETEEALDSLLEIALPSELGSETRCRLDSLPAKLDRAEKVALQRRSEELLVFGSRANPVYRPIVQEYQELATSIAHGRTRGERERFARVRQWREQLHLRMSRVDDYLNWYEATQARSASGVFAEYLRTASVTTETLRRRDPISVYLDAIEAQVDRD